MPTHHLRDIKPDDASWVFDACQDEQIQYWTTVPKPYLMQHAVSFTNNELNEFKIWVIENEENKPVGVISIHSVDAKGAAEVGYWVAPWGRGKGATMDALDLITDYAKSDSKIRYLQACISDLNIASQKVAEYAGLIKAEAALKKVPAGDQQTSSTFFRKDV